MSTATNDDGERELIARALQKSRPKKIGGTRRSAGGVGRNTHKDQSAAGVQGNGHGQPAESKRTGVEPEKQREAGGAMDLVEPRGWFGMIRGEYASSLLAKTDSLLPRVDRLMSMTSRCDTIREPVVKLQQGLTVFRARLNEATQARPGDNASALALELFQKYANLVASLETTTNQMIQVRPDVAVLVKQQAELAPLVPALYGISALPSSTPSPPTLDLYKQQTQQSFATPAVSVQVPSAPSALDQARIQEQLRHEQELRLRQQEEARIVEQLNVRKQEEARRLEQLQKQEELHRLEQLRKQEEARLLEQLRKQEEARLLEQLRKQEEARLLEQIRKQEEAQRDDQRRRQEIVQSDVRLETLRRQLQQPQSISLQPGSLSSLYAQSAPPPPPPPYYGHHQEPDMPRMVSASSTFSPYAAQYAAPASPPAPSATSAYTQGLNWLTED